MNLHIWPQPDAQNPSAGSSTSTSAFDAKSCSVGIGRVPRPTSMLATRVTLIPCSPHPLANSDSSSACLAPNTCDLHFALDKTSSFKLVPSDNQPNKKYQLALFIYRIARGHEVCAIARLFCVSGASSFIPRPS